MAPQRRTRRGQSLVEYILGVSVIAIGLAVGFIYLSDSTQESFENARTFVQNPYP